MVQNEKFSRCLVLAGGGFRFGYYFGLHAALVAAGKSPDILLGSCGGALAASVIASTSDESERRDWLYSRELFDFFCQIESTAQARLDRVFRGLIGRQWPHPTVKRVPDIFSDYLFVLPEVPPLPRLSPSSGIEVAILAGRILFEPSAVNTERNGKTLFRETIFGSNRVARLLTSFGYEPGPGTWQGEVIDRQVEVKVGTAWHHAVRASIADPFYFSPANLPAGQFTGGLINLFPYAMANRLADKVVQEIKAPLNRLYAAPAVRAVFGMRVNHYLPAIYQAPAEIRIDCRSAGEALGAGVMCKKLDWRTRRLVLLAPRSYADFVKMMEAQWAYGYRQAARACHSTSLVSS